MQAKITQMGVTLWPINWRWFSLPPLLGSAVLLLALALGLSRYQARHDALIYTGVTIGREDVGGLSAAQAQQHLAVAETDPTITLIDPRTGQEWSYRASQLGAMLDVPATVQNAYQIGRTGDLGQRLGQQFDSWYYGYGTPAVLVLDESYLLMAIDQIAQQVEQPPVDASIQIDGEAVNFVPSQVGRTLDKADLHQRLLSALGTAQPVRLELLIHESQPRLIDAVAAATDLQRILSGPMEFYLQTPIDGLDLERLVVSTANLRDWLRINLAEDEAGQARYQLAIDEEALRNWLGQYAAQVAREPERARFYFDDPTQELVLVEPHVNGRVLDVEATMARFREQIMTANRSVPLVIEEIVPTVHANATAAELGITELVAERTTWFYGSSDERKHNIARSASNFYGIVIAPGEQFSFNKYLGDISEEDGYKPALIIYGGQTIEGLGGGVCQVSTTLYQTAFWGGFDLEARTAHAYQVGYYEDGEGTGMDATVFSPLVDFTFTNNTEHHLLIENYYNEVYESLTFKIYSADIGRRVEKRLSYDNVRDPLTDRWEYNPSLDYGAIEQIEWAAEGATVTVERIVYNFANELRDQDFMISNYIPWGNVYQYGPGVDPNNLPRNWYNALNDNHGTLNIFESG